MDDLKNEVLRAENKIRSYLRKTPLEPARELSRNLHTNLYLKCENLQHTGSFKVRGAFNKLLSLTPGEKAAGIVTASSGNHGAAVSFGLQQLQIKGKVYVPENASTAKVANIKNFNVPLAFYGTDCMQTELHAIQYANTHQMTYISPYNDISIIGGQGTIAIELVEQLSHIDAVFVSIGGGGLIAGIAGYLKAVSPHTKIIGCLPENSPVMSASMAAGHIIEMATLPTLSDATAGGIEPGAITFALCQRYVDEYVLVSEAEIQAAMLQLIQSQRLLTEGASGVALAAAIKSAASYTNQNIVAVLSGGNVSLETLKLLL